MLKSLFPVLFFILIMPLITGLGIALSISYDYLSEGSRFSWVGFIGFFLIYAAGAYVFGFVPSLLSGLVAKYALLDSKILLLCIICLISTLSAWLVGWLFLRGMTLAFIVCGAISSIITCLLYFNTTYFKNIHGG